jgi:FixJ family two-component response regulator
MAKSRIRVAVVDDDASVRKALGRLLRSAAFDVVAYSSGAELLEFLDTFRPGCIILDLHMPVMTGLDIQRHLGRIKSRVPIIVITGHDNPQVREEAVALGASAYFAKPIEGDDLMAAIRKATSGIQACQ